MRRPRAPPKRAPRLSAHTAPHAAAGSAQPVGVVQKPELDAAESFSSITGGNTEPIVEDAGPPAPEECNAQEQTE